MSDFNGVIVFGPSRTQAAAPLQAEGVNVVEWDGEGSPAIPVFAHGRVTLNLVGYVPVPWLNRDLQTGWLQHLLEGTRMGFNAMERPEIRGIGNQADNAFSLLLHWEDVSASTVRSVAEAIARSYHESAGFVGLVHR